jgi:hypothetical protein
VVSVTNNDGRGFYLASTIANNSIKLYKDNTNVATNTSTFSGSLPSQVQPIGKNENKTFSFATIGDGLTDTDALNFYNAVQVYQTTLGRQVNIPVVSDTDAQAFLNAANITNFQQASAVNKLVTDLKAAGVWTKMKAIYPFVGGSAASHKFNLKDPRDLDVAYRLVFSGGGTHTSNGYKGNGSNSYADSKFAANILSPGNAHLSFYNRTTTLGSGYVSAIQDNAAWNTNKTVSLAVGNANNGGVVGGYFAGGGANSTTVKNTTWTSLSLLTSTATNSHKVYNSGIVQGSSTTNSINTFSTSNLIIGAHAGSLNYVGGYETAFVSFGDGLTDSDATSFDTAVQKFQTALGRQVDTPVYNNGLVLNLDAGNANSYPGIGTTWFDLAAGNNGTLVNGPTYDINNGGSLSFSTNKYVTIPTGDSYNFGTTNFTIEGWVNFNSISTDQIFVSKFASWMSNLDFVFRFEFATRRIIFMGGDFSSISLQNTYNITTNTWYNYCVSRVSGVTTLYLNGIAQMSHTGSVNIPNDKTDIRLGYAQDNTEPLNGRMSGFKVYNRGLSSTEILNNFNSTRGRFGL